MVDVLRDQNLRWRDFTVVTPCTKGTLPRPIVNAGMEVAREFGMQILPSEHITKTKKYTGDVAYAGLASMKERSERRYRYINIEEGTITTSRVLLIDDSIATGLTLSGYACAVSESKHRTGEDLDIYGLVFAKYETDDFLIEDINNHFIFWDMPNAVDLFNQLDIFTNTASRILLGMSNYIFARFVSRLSLDTISLISGNWDYFIKKNIYQHRKGSLLEKMAILQKSRGFTEKVRISRAGSSVSVSPGTVLLFNSREEFDQFLAEHKTLPFQDFEFVVIREAEGYRPVRFLRNSGSWVPELNVFPDLRELVAKTLMGELEDVR
jgi:hypothetical protein